MNNFPQDVFDLSFSLHKIDESHRHFYEKTFDKCSEIIIDYLQNKRIMYAIDFVTLFKMLFEEHRYTTGASSSDELQEIENNDYYLTNITILVTDKYIKLYIDVVKFTSDISNSSPVITSIKVYLDVAFKCFSPLSFSDPTFSLLTDIVSRTLSMGRGIVVMLSYGLSTDAFSGWRTMHESECVLKVLFTNPDKVKNSYLKHITYNTAFRGGVYSVEQTDAIFETIKKEMREKQLASKDLKKYIEYGWLYAIKDVEKNFQDFRLNFRNGLQEQAELGDYSDWYDMASEITHSSPILFYAKTEYFLKLTVVALYETTLRIDKILLQFINTAPQDMKVIFQEFLQMRAIYLPYLEMILKKESEGIYEQDE